jgi:hypothetical protein
MKGTRRLGGGVAHHHAPALAPDGERLLFAAGDGAEAAWVLADRRGRVARVLPGPAALGGAAIASDGALAFTRALRPAPEIWYTPAETLPAVRLLGGDGARYADPAFSPDGRTLACTVATDGAPARILLVDVERGARRELPRGDDGGGTREDARPAFSPDGATLFFVGRTGGEWAIYAQRSDGSAPPARLCSGRAAAPVSPGLLVVERPVAGDPSGAARLVAVELDGGDAGRERELDSDADAREPTIAWGVARPRIAWVTLIDGRRELVAARLRGVTLAGERVADHEDGAAHEDGDGDGDEDQDDGDHDHDHDHDDRLVATGGHS